MRNLRRIAAFIPAIALALAAWPVARATTVQALSLSEMVRRSPRIVHGTVVETHSQWEEGGSLIYTYVTLAPKEMLKGKRQDGEATVTFRQIGGVVGDKAVYVPGTPRFSPKQEVLVFLTGSDRGGYSQVMGIFQGAFRPGMVADGRRRVEGVSPDAIGSLAPEGETISSGAAESPASGTFDQFLQRVRKLVREQEEGPAR